MTTPQGGSEFSDFLPRHTRLERLHLLKEAVHRGYVRCVSAGHLCYPRIRKLNSYHISNLVQEPGGASPLDQENRRLEGPQALQVIPVVQRCTAIP